MGVHHDLIQCRTRWRIQSTEDLDFSELKKFLAPVAAEIVAWKMQAEILGTVEAAIEERIHMPRN